MREDNVVGSSIVMKTVTLVVVASLAGCDRTPTNGPAGAKDSAPAASGAVEPKLAPIASSATATATANDQARPPAEVALRVRRESTDGPPVAFLVAPEVGFEARIREVKSPYVCRLVGEGTDGVVTCTPLAQQAVARIKASPEGIELSPLLGKPSVKPIPTGRAWFVRASEASERDLPDSGCAADAPARDVPIKFRMHHDMDEGSFFYLMLPSSRAGGVQGAELFRHQSQISCRSEGTEAARHVGCGGARIECDFRIDGASVAFECKGSWAASGRFLLPCGSRAKLTTAGVIGMTFGYY